MYVGENNDYSRETRLRISPERNAFLVEEEKPGGIIAYKEISPTNHQVCSASGVITPLHQRYIARQIAALNRPLYFCCERSLRCLALYQAVIHQLVSGHGMMKRSALL